MNNEIKEKKSKAGIIIAVVVAIVVIAGGIMLFKSNKADTTVQKQETVATTRTESKEEKTVARIDLTTKLVDSQKTQFEVYVNGSETPEKQASWMHKFGNQGYVIQRDSGIVDVIVKVIDDTDINILLKGLRDEKEGKLVKHWVEYTSFIVNDEEILPKVTSIWYGKPLTHKIKAKKGEIIKLKVEWQKNNFDRAQRTE